MSPDRHDATHAEDRRRKYRRPSWARPPNRHGRTIWRRGLRALLNRAHRNRRIRRAEPLAYWVGPRLLTRVLLGGLRLELEADELFVPDDLGVVARLDRVRLAGTDLDDRAVLVRDAHPPCLHDSDVSVLAALRS